MATSKPKSKSKVQDPIHEYDEATQRAIATMPMSSIPKYHPLREQRDMPYNTAGIPSLMVRDAPELQGTNVRGLIFSSNALKDEKSNRGMQPNMFLSPDADKSTVAHEAEHLLARQNLGFAESTRDKFSELLEQNNGYREARFKRNDFLTELAKEAPNISTKYGVRNRYLDPEFIMDQGAVGLYEILATLAGIEAANNVDLTRDPELRKTLFKDPDVREAYNAVTGLRQTRLDPRDLPPYTRQPEKAPEGAGGKLKKLLGFAAGGCVRTERDPKLI